jgi:hypothetical protein
MNEASTDQRDPPDQATPIGHGQAPDGYATSIPPPLLSEAEQPRLIEEHHVVGRYGEDEIEATDDRGRRWYHLRPEPRRRYDVIGFNYTWWLIWIVFMLVIFLPWGRGWGY